MRVRILLMLTALAAASVFDVASSRADFVLTDKNNANGVTIPSGSTATNVYVMETRDNAFAPSVPGATAGFRFNAQDGVGNLLSTPTAGDNRQGYGQTLAGNSENGYVGTVIGQAWGNAITLGLGTKLLVNGSGPDVYITAKNLSSDVVQTTSTQDKSFDIAFHVVNQGSLNGWHLYNAAALPANYQPADGSPTNVLGAIDLSALKFGSGNFLDADLPSLTTFMPANIEIDMISLVNSNAANAHAWGFLGNNTEAPTGFVARRDFDNADSDGNAFTGVDYLVGRYGTRNSNGQNGPQAWFVGLMNTAAVPETSSFVFGSAICGAIGLTVGVRKLRARKSA